MLACYAMINQMVVKSLNHLFCFWNLVLCVGYAGLSDLNKSKSIYFDWLVMQKLMSLGISFLDLLSATMIIAFVLDVC
jgi:hypothetical protein